MKINLNRDHLTPRWNLLYGLIVLMICVLASFTEVQNPEGDSIDLPKMMGDRAPLQLFYDSLNGSNWENDFNWGNPAVTLDNWFGISAANDVVLCLDLTRELEETICEIPRGPRGNDLEGRWPTGFVLENVRIFSLSKNPKVTGPFPDFSGFQSLQQLYLEETDFYGPIHPGLAQCTNLTHLQVDGNRLEGRIPDAIGSLPELQWFDVADNKLTGPFPTFVNAEEMLQIDISSNRYTFSHILPLLEHVDPDIVVETPQQKIFYDTVLTLGLGLPFSLDLKIDSLLTSNTYHWQQDGQDFRIEMDNQLEFDSIEMDHAGTYVVAVTNPGAPRLTLYSYPIQIQVCTPSILEFKETLCPGESFKIGDRTFTRDTLIIFRGASATGCDSALMIDLEFYPEIEIARKDFMLCAGSTIEVGGVVVDEPATVFDTLRGASPNGCDSIIQNVVDFYTEPEVGRIDTVICPETVVEIEGFRIEEAGEHLLSIPGSGANDCDSILIVSLTFATPEAIGSADAGSHPEIVCQNEVQLAATLPPKAKGVWQAVGEILFEDPFDASTIAFDLKPGENKIWWSLSSGNCEFYDSDTISIYFEPAPSLVADTFHLEQNDLKIDSLFSNDQGLEFIRSWTAGLQDAPIEGEFTRFEAESFTYQADRFFHGMLQFSYLLISDHCGNYPGVGHFIINRKTQKGEQPPNVITPNGDGLNDEFVIPILDVSPGSLPQNSLTIRSRTGKILFHMQGYDNKWGGTDQDGNPLPGGTYFYHFQYEDGAKGGYSGDLLILY